MRNICFINGRDVGLDFGFVVSQLFGLYPTLKIDSADEQLIGRAGSLRNVGNIPLSAKPFVMRGAFRGSSNADMFNKMQEFFKWVRFGELHEIETVLQPGKVFWATFQSTGFDGYGPQALSRVSDTKDIVFKMNSPLLYDKYPLTYVGNVGSRISPMLGNVASTPKIWIQKHSTGVTNPTISLYRANGTLVKTVPFTVTLGEDDHVVQDSDEFDVKTSLAGVIADAPNIAPAGDSFFLLDPADGDAVNGKYPYFTSTAALIVRVRRVYTV